jgi:hypothetical protein
MFDYDRCPIDRNPLRFYGISIKPWQRWTVCDTCGYYVGTNEAGGERKTVKFNPVVSSGSLSSGTRSFTG